MLDPNVLDPSTQSPEKKTAVSAAGQVRMKYNFQKFKGEEACGEISCLYTLFIWIGLFVWFW